MVLAFARYIVRPADGLHGVSHLMQKPFFRLVGQGPAWVALFFILMGFVNALRPIKLARAGEVESALKNLGVSSFKRSFRLFLPATTATILSWFVCQLGAYETARKSDAYWLYTTSPLPSASWGAAVVDLLSAIRQTWSFLPDNPYDQPQWALLYLFQGSMFVFTTLLVTVNLKPLFRVAVLVLCYFWSFTWSIKIGDRMFKAPCMQNLANFCVIAFVGINVFTGLLLVELNYSQYPLLLSAYSLYFAPPLALLSLFLMSFPAQFQPWTYWSNALLVLAAKIAPENIDVGRYWPTIGAQLLSFTIVLSPHMRRSLSHPWLLWLGKISFPLYLLHGSLMRSVLAWMTFQGQVLEEFQEFEGQNSIVALRYPVPGTAMLVVVIPIFMVILLAASHGWAIKIEPWFGYITDKAQKTMIADGERPTVLPIRRD